MKPLNKEQQGLDRLYTAGRHSEFADALAELGRFVTGQPCVLIHAGFGLRAKTSVFPVHDCTGTAVTGVIETVPDIALSALDLELIKHRSAGKNAGANRSLALGILVLRAGLLDRMLDLSFAHLTPRTSGGQKVLQHQLVKAGFTNCHAVAQQIRSEACYFTDPQSTLALATMQTALSAATAQASKLMGGHGFLLGSLNSIESLSLYLAGICGNDLHTRIAA